MSQGLNIDLFIVAVVAFCTVCIFIYEHTPIGAIVEWLLGTDES